MYPMPTKTSSPEASYRLTSGRADAGAVRQRIVTGARRHFLAHGFRSVTMDDIAGELGMSKKTLYAHFTSKLALVEAVLQDKVATAEADLARIATEDSPDFLAVLHEMLDCVHRHTAEILPSFVRDLRRETPELFKIVEDGRRLMIQRHFGSLFAKGRKQGMIRKDIPTDLITEVLLAATQTIMNPAKMETLGLTPKTGYAAIINIVLEGVLNTKGKSS